MKPLEKRLRELARVPVLLVASDYDGTLAPIVPDPNRAAPDREALVALKSLAALPQTHVAIISGRALRDLTKLTGSLDEIHLVGSHGSEFDLDFASALPADAVKLRKRIVRKLRSIAGSDNGFSIEEKPASVAFHFRKADAARAAEAVDKILSQVADYEGVFTRHGKKVIELGVVATDKGRALETIRHRVGASAALFVGDDKTDEDAFATLRGPDVGIKVGPGETAARHRLKDTREVARLLAQLCELRSAWIEGADAVPIDAHSMLSDQRTVALVTPDARISWFCAPRIDSQALFAELLGGPTTGFFSVRPGSARTPPRQRYQPDTMILETRWPKVTVTDYLDCSERRPHQRAGRTDLVRVVSGTGKVVVEFAPRIDFGRVATRLNVSDNGVEVLDSPDPVVLRAPGLKWSLVEEGPHQTAVAEVRLGADPLTLELRYGTATLRNPVIPEPVRRAQTEAHWKQWCRTLTLPDVARDLVKRSALVLKALCYGPTGAIAAAATTSLPEHIGGVRNWDYRYCWIRDAALSAAALVRLGSRGEAMHYLDWVLDVLDETPSPERLRPLYTVTRQELGPEAEIAELRGYRASRPVRVGNSAAQQVQLDVFGPVVDLVALLFDHGAPLSAEHWRLVEAMVEAVQRRWQGPDHGIWEVRRPRRQHVHSKVMCWVTVDRAVRVAEQVFNRPRPEWNQLREEIAEDVLEKGWSKSMGAFTAAYGADELDASALHIGLSGLIEPRDDRFVSTVDAIHKHLREQMVVRRYLYDDGLPGIEGGFHLCTSWLIDSYLLVGRHDDARELFDHLTGLAGPTGLFSEEYNPSAREALGNHPQAFTHLGLVNNAMNLAAADRGP